MPVDCFKNGRFAERFKYGIFKFIFNKNGIQEIVDLYDLSNSEEFLTLVPLVGDRIRLKMSLTNFFKYPSIEAGPSTSHVNEAVEFQSTSTPGSTSIYFHIVSPTVSEVFELEEPPCKSARINFNLKELLTKTQIDKAILVTYESKNELDSRTLSTTDK